MPMTPTAKAQLQIHFCVLLWGFTAILGKLISLPAQALVGGDGIDRASMFLIATDPQTGATVELK